MRVWVTLDNLVIIGDTRKMNEKTGELVISVFPGIDLLGEGFEDAGFCVVPAMINLNQYDGGKGVTFRHLINQTPPHKTFVSAFAGGCALAMNKRPAERNIIIDRDERVIAAWVDHLAKNGGAAASSRAAMGAAIVINVEAARWELYVGDAVVLLPLLGLDRDAFVYADPPYLFSARLQQRPLYKYEMGNEAEHGRLLGVLKGLECRVMLSGYWSDFYDDNLDWRAVSFSAYDRGHNKRLEYLWMNYDEPVQLHDYSFLGDNFREREVIKRKAARWVNRFNSLGLLERQAIIGRLQEAGVL